MPKQQINRELKEAFIRQLPKRIVDIKEEWDDLCQREWDKPRLKHLYTKAQDLAGASGRFGLIEISEGLFMLETYLSSFVDSDLQPSQQQSDTGDKLIADLRKKDNQLNPEQKIKPQAGKTLFYLHSQDRIAPGLISDFEFRGCNVLTFSTADDLEGELSKRLPDIIIIDDKFLQQMATVNRELAMQQELQQTDVPVICISQSHALEKRLLALRMGTDAYFLTPVSNKGVIEKALALTTKKDEHYRIIIVEDDPSQAKFVASILNKGGMKTLEVTEPLKVLNALDQFRPDLILMDLYMPNANGIELTTIIREHPDFVTTPIVFLSGEQDRDKQLKALSVGGDDFLSKPIRPRHLISTIANRIHRAKMLQTGDVRQTVRDPISGLFNRRYFFEQLDSLISQDRTQSLTAAIIYLSIPNIDTKKENLLAELGTLITEQIESQDIPSRLDNESFAILATRPHSKNITALAEKLESAISRFKHQTESSLKLDPHFGIAYIENNLDAAETVSNAEEACKQANAKDVKIQRYIRQEPSESIDKDEPELESLIQKSLDKENFQLLFHPLTGQGATATEIYDVILRIRSPNGEPISEQAFRDGAVGARLTVDIDRWLLDKVLGILSEKKAAGKQTILFIAQSVASLKQESTLSWLKDQLRRYQMVGSGLVFEYRLAEIGSDPKIAKLHFAKLQEMGIKISLSQFTANTAAFRALEYLNIDYVRMTKTLLNIDSESVEVLTRKIHKTGVRVVLPSVDGPSTVPQHWLTNADLIPGSAH